MRAGAEQDQAFLPRQREDLRGLGVGRRLGLAVTHQLHAGHGSKNPDVTDERVLGGPGPHALLDDRADPRGPFGQLLVSHHVQHREAGRAGTNPPSPRPGSMMPAATRCGATADSNRSLREASAISVLQPRYSYGKGTW